MDTKTIATKYRLAHWAGILRERQESGLSIAAYCKQAGFHENNYYYWQKKLREAACESIAELKRPENQIIASKSMFTEVKLAQPAGTEENTMHFNNNQIYIEFTGIKLTAGGGYPTDKLAAVLRELVSSC